MAWEKEDSWWVEEGKIIAMCDGRCDGSVLIIFWILCSNIMYATCDQTSQHEIKLHDSMVSIILYDRLQPHNTLHILYAQSDQNFGCMSKIYM
mgnify:CR=1 FL=1